jgi:hypothetical protein
MSEHSIFFEVYPMSLNRQGEELCGDQAKVLRTQEKTMVVLSDGLGSGVKANILARLTTEIILTMLREATPIEDVVETVVGTLPVCKTRHVAYSTFIIAEIYHQTHRFKLTNFDSPQAFYIAGGRLTPLEFSTRMVHDRMLRISEGVLSHGDFLGLASDGVLHAGVGKIMNSEWGWDQIGSYIQKTLMLQASSARAVVDMVIQKTRGLYGGDIGDDATLVGVLAHKPSPLIVFTGPPSDKSLDDKCAHRVLEFQGRKVVCGGTTSEIVARMVGETVETDVSTAREDIPPIGSLTGVDLITEGVLTIAKALKLIEECAGNVYLLPLDRNGAALLARELLKATNILFLVGESNNPYYQNPLLPRNITIRHNLIDLVAAALHGLQKEVVIEWC